MTTVRLFTQGDCESLTKISDLCHLFHHRNRNQHRRAVWFRHFKTFRRQAAALADEIRSLLDVPSSHAARANKLAKDSKLRITLEQRLSLWQDILVPKWQHAFSQLAANERFAVLGLILIALLAQVSAIVRIIAAFDDLGQAEVEKVLHEFAQEGKLDPSFDPRQTQGVEADFGEVIQRKLDPELAAVDPVDHGLDQAQAIELVEANDATNALKRHKDSKEISTRTKKRRKGNAIDDLFQGLN